MLKMQLNRRLKTPVLKALRKSESSGAGVQHRDGATVLRPAGDIVTDSDRTFLAVGDGPHAVRIDAAGREIASHRLGTACAERDVVFAGAALVRMAFDGEGIAVVGLQPLRLLLQRGDCLRAQFGLVALEEYAVADIDHEILLTPRGCRAGHRSVGTDVVLGAGAHR